MKRHLIAFLDSRPEDELSKILNWAFDFQAGKLDDKTPYENRTASTIFNAIYELEKPEPISKVK